LQLCDGSFAMPGSHGYLFALHDLRNGLSVSVAGVVVLAADSSVQCEAGGREVGSCRASSPYWST
jgi:hypothetical protein